MPRRPKGKKKDTVYTTALSRDSGVNLEVLYELIDDPRMALPMKTMVPGDVSALSDEELRHHARTLRALSRCLFMTADSTMLTPLSQHG